VSIGKVLVPRGRGNISELGLWLLSSGIMGELKSVKGIGKLVA
jgi:hypothetical protein